MRRRICLDRNHFANPRRIALGRIEVSAIFRDCGEVLLQAFEFANAHHDLGAVSLDQVDDVLAGRIASVSDRKHLTNFGERQADCLRCANERQARQHPGLVHAIAGCRSVRRRE